MKMISISTALIFASIASADERFVQSSNRSWPSPFDPKELTHQHDCFGNGFHRGLQTESFAGEITTSRLKKGDSIWEVSTKDGHYADFQRTDAAGNRTIYFTICSALCNNPAQFLVDVFTTDKEASFLTVDMCGYMCFQVRRKPIPASPPGSFLLPPHAANSELWYVSRVVTLRKLGYMFHDGEHHTAIQSIKLTSHNTVEVQPVGDERRAEVFDFSSGQPIRNGEPVLQHQHPWPVQYPSAPWTEDQVIKYFAGSGRGHLTGLVYRLSGGKDRVLEVLDQFQDQRAADDIKQRILAAFAAKE
jgi:hypothetical protein